MRGQWVRHPRWSLAAKGAAAASLAWLVALLAPAPFSEYPYYAPLGAVVAMSNTAARSLRESMQAIGALLVGAVIARVVDAVLTSSVLSVAVVVAVALLCAGWRIFGEMGSWVATSGLFVLILGGAEQIEYTGVFSGLIVLGAAIGVGINLTLPPLPLTPSELMLDHVREALVDQVRVLADRLESEGPLLADEWQHLRRELSPTIARAQHAVSHTDEAVRANRRAHRYSEWTRSHLRRAEALVEAGDVVDDVVRLLVEWEHADREKAALGPGLRPALVAAMRTYADALRSDRGEGAAAGAVARCRQSVGELADAVRADAGSSGRDHFVAGALVVTLWRGESALVGTEQPD
ncbi:aromatic acid exporter family protein [Myceligenerans cantabricum]